MQRWQLIAACALAVLLAAGLALFLVWSGGEEPAPTPLPRPFAGILMKEVVRFTVRGADGRETRLERGALNEWYLVAPISAKADQDLVTWLLADLLGVKSSNAAPAAQVDLAYAGLITPTATIVLGLASGAERAVQVGLPEPGYMAYFVRIGDEVYLFPWDVVDRAVLWLDAMPVPAEPPPAGGGG